MFNYIAKKSEGDDPFAPSTNLKGKIHSNLQLKPNFGGKNYVF